MFLFFFLFSCDKGELDSKFITKLCGFFEDSRSFYIVMEPCNGGKLFDCLCKKDSFDENSARRIIRYKNSFQHLHHCKII